MIYSDRALSQKLERAEARANADFVATRARLHPDSGAAWIDFDGVYAMFDGPHSPCTQTFGLGMFGEIAPDDLKKIESFFSDHDAPVYHEVSPMADKALMPMLNDRGYRPIELTSVMYRSLDNEIVLPVRVNPSITTRVIRPYEVELWARTSARGWGDEAMADFMFGFGMISAQCAGAFPFIAELDGLAIATGMMFIADEVAVLAGASTVPTERHHGAQNALLAARLQLARERGCTLANMGTLPGSQSQRNAQNNGFNIAYTRTKWQLFGSF